MYVRSIKELVDYYSDLCLGCRHKKKGGPPRPPIKNIRYIRMSGMLTNPEII